MIADIAGFLADGAASSSFSGQAVSQVNDIAVFAAISHLLWRATR